MSIQFIPASGDTQDITDIESEPGLKWLQDKVGGYIEIVRYADNHQMIVNENGISMRLNLNEAATKMYREAIMAMTNLEAQHVKELLVYGNVVILSGEHLCK